MSIEHSGRTAQWMAVRPGDDIALLAEKVAAAHESFVESADAHDVRAVVRDSWLRSRREGVDPDRATGVAALGAVDLTEYRAAHPMALVRPVIHKLLVEDLAETGLLVAITDAAGRMLWVEGDHSTKDRAARMNFAEGADWSEASVGTNAPGTSLALDHGVQIFGAEHFSRAVHEWSCSAAPVHDPTTGRILGAIDISGGQRVAAPEMLSLVRATVATVESELRFHLLERPNLFHAAALRLELLGNAAAAVVRDGQRTTLPRRHAEILLLLSEHPEGLTAEQLGVLLDEQDLDAVTIRAEISRLRRVLGPDAVASRPYRLGMELHTDIADVRRALDRGDVATAIRRYTGPVLPDSRAPGVAEVRDELRACMRAGLLRAGDPTLLARWTASTDGRDDVGAWTAYLATLDSGSALHAQVRARVELL
ncbi:MAG: transcriptional regulator, partial [Aldersonia sp.]|nr:transcriptional regulator [Aldersonia sp.]